MLYCREEKIEDVREIRGDATLREITGLKRMTNVLTIGVWLGGWQRENFFQIISLSLFRDQHDVRARLQSDMAL